ncbi:MAG: hypothetical protein JRI25_26550 [Deltaproteobacteria bacterium]|nr:hypothetical protein [Deltaproteobacteria bacterium]
MTTHTILVTWAANPAEDAVPTLPHAGYQPVDADGADAREPYEIGRGGLGRVLTYRDKRLGRIVACKELCADPSRGLERRSTR